ncbi:hypothetical protein HDK90DRAFT_176936 [Phyllosticta capitalensis]|uniref:Uncharacterized protein n=1 Tax=Phyllosticta capitalensis TaxID=121624 RepID=A0ABR1YVM4_9PEZI
MAHGALPAFPAAAETRYTPAHQHRRNASAASFSSTTTAATMTEEKVEKPDLEVGGTDRDSRANRMDQLSIWRLSLRASTTFVNVVGFMTLICAAGNMRKHDGRDWLTRRNVVSASLAFAFSLGYNGIALMSLGVQRRRRSASSPLHPFVELFCDLVFWVCFVIIALLAFLCAVDISTGGHGETKATDPADRYDQRNVRQPLYYVSGSMAVAAAALHFVLFVVACVDSKRRRSSSASPAPPDSPPRRPSSSSTSSSTRSTSRFSYFGASSSSAADDEAKQAAFAEERARQLVGEMVRTGRVRVSRGPDGVVLEGAEGEGEGMEPLLAAVERGLLKAGVVRGPEGTVLVARSENDEHERAAEGAEARPESSAGADEEEAKKGDKVRWG